MGYELKDFTGIERFFPENRSGGVKINGTQA
jgi:hypothetical protein